MRYSHLALHSWSSLPRGEEVFSFAAQSEGGQIERESLLEFPGEVEAKGWVHRIVRDLSTSPRPATLFYTPGTEGTLFEIIHADHTLNLDHVQMLPHTQARQAPHWPHTKALAVAVDAAQHQAYAALSARKRAIKSCWEGTGGQRWVETFTDGSYVHQRHQGGAAFLRDDGSYGALRFHADNSNETEFIAALIAITAADGERVSINSDCRLVVRTLTNLSARASGVSVPYGGRRNLAPLEEATLQALTEVIGAGQVRARWVRGHCGNRMNTGADRLAKAMRSRGGRPAVASTAGIVREACGVSSPVSHGFTAHSLGVPGWFAESLRSSSMHALSTTS